MKVFLLLLALCLSVSCNNPEDQLDIQTSVNVDVDSLDLTDEEKADIMKTADEQAEPAAPEAKSEPETVEQLNKADAPPPGMKQTKISYKQPELTEEEQKSNYFPQGMLCDACQIVVFELGTSMALKESKIPKKSKKKTLGEIDLMEITEDACDKNKFEKYAIQQFNGQIALKGPAFPNRNEPGMSMGGGLWPVRYANYCGNIMEKLYEDEIYAAYRQGNLFNELCMTGAGTKDCAKILKEIPDAVHFKASLSKDEEICSVSDPNTGKCTKKPSGKTEL